VRDFRGHVVAAVNISAPRFRIGRSLHAAGREVKAAADHLSRALTSAPSASEATPASAPGTRRIS
jgi:IclR family KDG regulon transcriptional repressor